MKKLGESSDMMGPFTRWNGLGVVTRYDPATQAWIFIALHDATLGAMTGGTRIKVYDRPEDGLWDAMRLAEGMTHKWAGIGVAYGGGKGVIALSRALAAGERPPLLRRYGRLIESLGGRFMTGQDLGTTPEDMLVLADETAYVHGVDYVTREVVDPGPFTAHGVYVGMCAALRSVFGSPDPRGRRVLVQGVGDVGAPLARRLGEADAELLVSDVDGTRAAAVAAQVKGRVVPPEAVVETPCDVHAPCAVGATLNRETIPRLQCRVVAGSANNQLAETADGDRLHARGILYAPDYIINAGGAAAFAALRQGIRDERELYGRVDGIASTLAEIFEEARDGQESPVRAAGRRVERVLRRAAAPAPAD
jgi:glutamate dehydrogenase/leucine dehydrogenase